MATTRMSTDGTFGQCGKRLILTAVLLLASMYVTGPSRAQQDPVAALDQKMKALYDAGKYSEELPLAQRSLAIREKALGQDNPDVALSLNNLARVYDELGRYADAEPLFKRALAIREKTLGRNHSDVAVSLYNLAALYFNQGRYPEAEPLFKRALAIRENAPGADPAGLASALNGLAVLYKIQGRYADAEPLYARALAIREKALGPNHPDVGIALNNLASLYENEGRTADAEPLYRRALAVWEKALGENHPNVASVLHNLAGLYEKEARYAEAEPLYARSRAIWEKALGQDHPNVARSLNNLAFLYLEQGRLADAEPLYTRALAIRAKALGENHPDVARTLNDLALLYQKQGRTADALPLDLRALAIRENALGESHPDVARSRNNLAALYEEQRRTADALPLVRATIADGRADPSVALAVLFAAQAKNLISAADALDGALDVVQRASQTSAAVALAKLAVRLSAGSDRLADLVRKDQDLAAETESLNAAIIAAVSNEPSRRDAGAEQRMRDRMAAIGRERNALQKVFATEFPDYAALSNPRPLVAKEVQELLSADEALVVFSSDDKQSDVFALTRDAVDWRRISLGAAALADKVAHFRRGLDVEMVLDKDVLDAGGKPRELFDLAGAHALYADLLGPVEALIADKPRLIVVPTGALTALPFPLLVTQAPPAAAPASKDRMNAEDFALYRDAAWLAKRQAVSVLPSLASLKALRAPMRREIGTRPLIGFGDPIFGAERPGVQRAATARGVVTTAYTDFWQGAGIDRGRLAAALPRLADTADELRAVAQQVGAASSDLHLRAEASETVVKRAPLADYRIVYFATHGLVAGDVKGLAEPSLALTIPPQPSELDDGLLTASEVAQLKLNADWVVLSACNTVAGGKPGAEALSGLARAFFYAGARALLVSHWSVDSDAAKRLTVATFDNLERDARIGRAEALRRAMLAYLDDPALPRNAYPAFWGPFALIGEGSAR